MIYHIADKISWESALSTGWYQHATLGKEGFIHACRYEQIASVRDRYYKDHSNILLLHIDETLLICHIKYELSPSVNEDFPHVYGPINIEAVVKTEII